MKILLAVILLILVCVAFVTWTAKPSKQAKTVKQISDDAFSAEKCQALREDFSDLVKSLQSCQKDADCVIAGSFGCPLVNCLSVRNKNADPSALEKVQKVYQNGCSWLGLCDVVLECALQDNFLAACVDSLCVAVPVEQKI